MAVLTSTTTASLPLHTAVISNDETKLYNLLINVNSTMIDESDSYGRAPLHWAAMLGHDHLVQMLLSANACPNMQDINGNTPLHLVYTKNIRSARLLLNGINTSTSTNDTNTNTSNIINNADPDIQNYEGETPLFVHASKGNARIVKILLRYKANQSIPNNANVAPLYMAITNGHVVTVELLLTYANSNTSIINGTNDVGETLLHAAALIQGNTAEKMIYLLCTQGARFTTDKFNSTPLHWASAHNNHNAAKLFLEYGKATNTLHSFINHRDNLGNTPLHYAAWHGYDTVAYILLTYNADPTIRDTYGLTPKDYAVRGGKKSIIDMIDQILMTYANASASTNTNTTQNN